MDEEVTAVEVLVTGGDTDLGRTVAEGFRDGGHKVTLVGARHSDLEIVAKELDAEAIVCDSTDPASLTEARALFPHHLDTIINVPAPSWDAGDPRTYSIADTANAWRNALDTTVLSAVLTVQAVGDHLRSGGSIVSVVTENPPAGSIDAAIKATLSNWIAGQATIFGTRGITINAVASGRGAQAGYEGLSRTPPSVAAEVARLALFLTTPTARHISGQTLHVSQGALAHFG
ncbi:MAG TPA: SDR family oxidoreductase [Mycobacterium sp.]|nr:SDR family oxidoreductase [Mycobacterium sp.]HTX96426.1 SDR family oxidoreductase [Mycobacterium sp.]